MLKVGDRAPAFEAEDGDGNPVSLDGLLEKGPLVLYFYPKDFTPVCTREACFFRDNHTELADLSATVVGVRTDDPGSHRAFARVHDLPFPLLSDPDRRIARDYGAVGALGLRTLRVTYVIDRAGTVRGVFHHELRARKHVDAVRDLLPTL